MPERVHPDVTSTSWTHDPEATNDSQHEILVHWRPGCGFCGSLLRQLDRKDVAHRRVNIWDDQRAAATVRSVTGGAETVPTVLVGPAALVNPSVHQVLAAAAVHAPHLVPDGYEPPQPGRLARWLVGKLSGGGSPA